MRLVTIRCSALPMAFECPGSTQSPSVLIDSTDQAAANGTATHKALEGVSRGHGVPWGELKSIADEYGADADETKMLSACGAKLWEEVKEYFPDAMQEVALSHTLPNGVELTGHVDILSIVGTKARCGDWKCGRKDSDYQHQAKGYAALVLLDNPDLTEATSTLLWVRDRQIENYTMDRSGLAEWLRSFDERVVNWDGRYHPGRHCQFCNRGHECEAATAMQRKAVAPFAMQTVDVTSLAHLQPSEVMHIYQQAKLVEKLAASALTAIREHVYANGAIVADGKRIDVNEIETVEVDPLKAWPVLESSGFTPEDLAASIRIGVTAMKKQAQARAVRGKGAAAVRQLMQDLDVAGALRHGTTLKLEERRET